MFIDWEESWFPVVMIAAMIVLIFFAIYAKEKGILNDPTRKESCINDCHNSWTGVEDWTCVESCLKIK